MRSETIAPQKRADIIRKIKGLLEHYKSGIENDNAHEGMTSKSLADDLMDKYSITEEDIYGKKPKPPKAKPASKKKDQNKSSYTPPTYYHETNEEYEEYYSGPVIYQGEIKYESLNSNDKETVERFVHSMAIYFNVTIKVRYSRAAAGGINRFLHVNTTYDINVIASGAQENVTNFINRAANPK